MAIKKLVKINRKHAEASIKVSLSMNIVSINRTKADKIEFNYNEGKAIDNRASVNGFRNEKKEQPNYKRCNDNAQDHKNKDENLKIAEFYEIDTCKALYQHKTIVKLGVKFIEKGKYIEYIIIDNIKELTTIEAVTIE
ncbi:16994_t:CDS:2, partial [Gigaspora margarita]